MALASPTSAHRLAHHFHIASKASGKDKLAGGSIKAWQRAIAKNPSRQAGCFTASYPSLKWRQFPCQKPALNAPPQVIVRQQHSHPPQLVGNGTDLLVQATGTTSVTGSFPVVSPSATETENCMGIPGCTHNGQSNIYTLQLNPNGGFPCTLPASDPGSCSGWQQFVYDAEPNAIYIQYWLLDSSLTNTSTCPDSTWNLYVPPPGTDYEAGCYKDSPFGNLSQASPPLSVPPVSDLKNVTLTGSAVAGGNDELTMTVSGESIEVNPPQADIGLGGNWTQSEFGIFGDAWGSQAQFNAGTTVNPLMTVVDTQNSAPTCLEGGFTGETNNLSFGAAPPALGLAASGTGYLYSTQTYTNAPSTPTCANATTWGETHLITLRNDPPAASDLHYNFQSTGDYTLAQTAGFNVQTQQAPDPANTQLAVNQNLGAQIGGADVALCSGSANTRLFVNGRAVSLAIGGHHNLPSGVISLVNGGTSFFNNVDTYVIQDDSGNFVEAGPVAGSGSVPFWLDALVGTGNWPTSATGLLANANGNVDAIESRSGTVFTVPFAFKSFYGVYATSWSDSPKQSLMAACHDTIAAHNPTFNFGTNNLSPTEYKLGSSACNAAHVAIPLIDSCILDVGTIGERNTTNIYKNLPTNITWGAITQSAPFVPGAPTRVTAVPGTGSATVSFAPPTSNGGSAITDYTVTAADITVPRNGGQISSRASSPIVVGGLTSGDTYTFTVTATNKVGNSKPSSPSRPVTITSITDKLYLAS
jgi:hypothetical protein